MKTLERAGCWGLALTMCGALGATSAMAESSSVRLYGTVDAWAGSMKPIGAASSEGVVQSGGWQTSYWGLSGSEDLGAGQRAVFALESFFRGNTGDVGRYDSDEFFSRSAFVGLEGDWGRVTLGRNTTPYFLSVISTNPFVGSFGFGPSIYHTYMGNGDVAAPLLGDSSWNNSVAYASPAIQGFKLQVLYGRGNPASGSDWGEESGAYKWGGSLSYDQGPLAATLAVQQLSFSRYSGDLSARQDKQRAVLAGLAYDFGPVKLYGQFQQIDNRGGPLENLRVRGGQAGAAIPMRGQDKILLSYAYSRSTGRSDEKRNTWALGYEMGLSKRTQLYASYFSDRVDVHGRGHSAGVGIRHTF